MNEILIVTTDIDTSIKKSIACSEVVRWAYLARDYRVMRQLACELGDNFIPVRITDVLNQVADEIRSEYVQWIDTLNRANGNRLNWWFGAVSSRNIYSSNLFLYSCYLLVLQRIWQNPETRPNLIIADSPGLAECIALWIKANNADVRVRKVSSSRWVFRNIRPFLQYVLSVVIISVRYFAALFTRIGVTPQKIDGKRVIVDTFVHDYSVSETGVFRDRYFPFLHEFLATEGHRILVHPVLYGFKYNFVSIFRRIRKSSTSFIIQEDYLQLSDYAAALLAPLTLRSMKVEQGHFRDINLDPVVREEQRLQPATPVTQAILTYRLWRRLQRSGVELSWVINWYENQVIDKALIAGVRDAYPGVRIMGAQMFIHIPNYLSLYPSQSELEAGLTPDLMLQMGNVQCKAVLKYAHASSCRAAAALRYSHLFTEACSADSMLTKKDSILVLLPYNMAESLEILDILLDAVHDIPNGMECLIKCHPDYCSSADIVDAFGREHWPKEFRIWNGSLTEAFQIAAMVVVSNSTSMVEAVVLGIPTIFVGRQSNLNLNPMAEAPSATFVACYDGVQLVRAITRFRTLSQEERNTLIQNGLRLRDQYFTTVNDVSLSAFEISERTPCN